MKNYVQHGDTVALTAPAGGVTGGNGYLIGVLFVVAMFSAAEGESFEGRVKGVFDLPAATGAGTDFGEGVALYWDNTAKAVTKTATSNTLIGHAVAAKATAGTVARIRLSI